MARDIGHTAGNAEEQRADWPTIRVLCVKAIMWQSDRNRSNSLYAVVTTISGPAAGSQIFPLEVLAGKAQLREAVLKVRG
jgi:hypothetical protein